MIIEIRDEQGSKYSQTPKLSPDFGRLHWYLNLLPIERTEKEKGRKTEKEKRQDIEGDRRKEYTTFLL